MLRPTVVDAILLWLEITVLLGLVTTVIVLVAQQWRK
jgi:hypothetical protein